MRKVLATMAAGLLAVSLAGCGNSGGGSGGSGSGDKGTVGISMPTKTSERWVGDGDNMVKQFQAAGYKTDLQYADNNPQQQASQIDNMITKQEKLLVIAAVDGTALTSQLDNAKASKVPVISYDRLLLNSDAVDYYASFDNTKVGTLQGQYLVDKLGLATATKPLTIELFAGSSDDNNTKYFFNGAMAVLKPFLDSGKLVVKSGQTNLQQVTTQRWDPATAQSRMENLLSANYTSTKLDGVLSPYDGISIGIIAALKGVGYGTPAKPLPIITGQDAELASVKSIIGGQQTQTIYKDTRKLAGVAVQMGNAVLTGGKPETNDDKTYDNGKKVVPAYLLPPVSLDKTDVQKTLVDSGYYTAAQIGG